MPNDILRPRVGWIRGVCITLAAGALLPAQSVSFTARNPIDAGTNPVALASGDFNGDGILDLAIADQQSASVAILRGFGNGFFQAPVNQTVGVGPIAVVAGDFNSDGRLDLAIANFTSNTVSLLLGNGNGTFRTGAIVSATGPTFLAVGDFNGDGRLDLAVTNANAGSVSILLGNGDGTFRLPLTYTAGARPTSIAIGDFNGDGILDLAVADASASNIALLLGNGNGTFQLPRSFPAGPAPASVTTGDFNHDGKLDLAVANGGFSNAVSILLGNGNGTFRNPIRYAGGVNPSFILAADLNNDGNLDLAVADNGANTISVLLGFGDGFFQVAQSFTVGSAPAWIGTLDLNGDGKLDLLVTNSSSNTLSVLMNSSAVLQPVIHSIVNATSYASGPVAPGEMITIFGSNLGPKKPVDLALTAAGLVATALGQTQVLFDGFPAPLVFVRDDQVSAIVPFEIAGHANTQVTLEHAGLASPTVTLTVTKSAPGLFTADSSGRGQAVILNQDQSVNSASNPAAKGSIIVLYGTGAGQTNPSGVDGQLAGVPLPQPVLPVTVTIDGKAAEISYAGGAPGLVAGIVQINVRVPSGVHSSAVPVVFRAGSASSQPDVTLSVK